MTALASMSAVEGLAGYLAEVENRLVAVVEAHPGTVAAVGSDALAAGGKRLRPALTFLSARPGAPPPVTEGAAIELVHMASLVHDDIVDEARLRRGRAAAWTAHGPFAAQGHRRSPLRPGVRDPRGYRVGRAGRRARGRVARARARGGPAAAPAP